ncbi:g9235 [Coccomyxa elongata]
MARTRVLLFVATLLLVSSELCTAQTVDKESGAPTSQEQQKAASREEAKAASTKADAAPSRVSQMRDPTAVPAPAEAPVTPVSHSAFPGSTNPDVNTPGGSSGAFPGRVEKVPSPPPPAAPRTGLPGGYNYAGNNAAVMAERAAATAGQDANTAPKESVTTKSTRSATTKTKKKHQAESAEGAGAAGGVGQVTSSNVPAGGAAAAAAAQPAATSSTVGSASVISSGPQTAAQVTQPAQAAQPIQAAQPVQSGQLVQAAQPASAGVTTAGAAAVGSASVIQPPKNLVRTYI